jgi:hypothetical protein
VVTVILSDRLWWMRTYSSSIAESGESRGGLHCFVEIDKNNGWDSSPPLATRSRTRCDPTIGPYDFRSRAHYCRSERKAFGRMIRSWGIRGVGFLIFSQLPNASGEAFLRVARVLSKSVSDSLARRDSKQMESQAAIAHLECLARMNVDKGYNSAGQVESSLLVCKVGVCSIELCFDCAIHCSAQTSVFAIPYEQMGMLDSMDGLRSDIYEPTRRLNCLNLGIPPRKFCRRKAASPILERQLMDCQQC